MNMPDHRSIGAARDKVLPVPNCPRWRCTDATRVAPCRSSTSS